MRNSSAIITLRAIARGDARGPHAARAGADDEEIDFISEPLVTLAFDLTPL